MSRAVDFFLVYSFVKRLATPFKKWPAYQLGIIDENGKVLRKSSELKTKEEIKAWGYYDIMLANLKKLLTKLPGGSNPVVSMAAAMALLKEGKNFDVDSLVEELTTTASTGVDKTAEVKYNKKSRRKKDRKMKRLIDFLHEGTLIEGFSKRKVMSFDDMLRRGKFLSDKHIKDELTSELKRYIEAEGLDLVVPPNVKYYLVTDTAMTKSIQFQVALNGGRSWKNKMIGFTITIELDSKDNPRAIGVVRVV